MVVGVYEVLGREVRGKKEMRFGLRDVDDAAEIDLVGEVGRNER